MKKKIIIVFVILITISIAFFGVGLFLNNKTKPQNIYNSIIDKTSNNVLNFMDHFDGYLEKNDFMINSLITNNLISEEYKNKGVYDLEYLKKYNYINNLDLYKTNIILKHDTTNNKFLFNTLKYNDTASFMNYKYLIDNSTGYVLFSDYSNQFVNMGSSNYFENYTNNKSLNDNVSYLYKKVLDLFKRNIIKYGFDTYYVDTKINDKNINTRKLSIKIDDLYLHKLFSNIIDGLKDDEVSSKILNNTFSNFSKYKIKDSYKFLNNNENYIFNIYLSKMMSRPLKYELEYLNGNEKKSYVYDVESNNIYFYNSDQLKYRGVCKFESDNYKIDLFDNSNNEIGEFKLEKDNDNLSLLFDLDSDNKSLEYHFESSFKDNTNKITIGIKNVSDNASILSGNIDIESKILDCDKTNEDLSTSVLYSTLSEDLKNKYNNIYNYVVDKMEVNS